MISTVLSRPNFADDALADRWRACAAEADASFFQDWTWVGCLARERYPDPRLLEIRQDGRLLGMALFNRRRDLPWGETFFLHESGERSLDAVFTEHNGVPVRAEAFSAESMRRAIISALPGGARRRLVLSGVDPAWLRAAAEIGGLAEISADRPAPYVDLTTIPNGVEYVQTLSRNARQQIRRSAREYEKWGPLRVHRAETTQEGLKYFEEMVVLHTNSWTARGQSGAFATDWMRRFGRELLERGLPRGEIDMLAVTAGSHVIGYLLNFVSRMRVCAYQSGFAFDGSAPQLRPGLICHALAIEAARHNGAREYDFLAGAARYKTTLANAERRLIWLQIIGKQHPSIFRTRLRRFRQEILIKRRIVR